MDLVQRVKNICLSPSSEWPVIAGEATPPATLITGYVLPLAGVSYSVDGEPVVLRDKLTYKGMMLTGVPNFVYAVG